MAQGLLLPALLGCLVSPLQAQTDWYNTDRNRPLRTEDALVAERHAFELHLAPVTIARSTGSTHWRVEPELAWGLAPRTQIEVGFALGGSRLAQNTAPAAVENVDISILHALNIESLGVPAFAISAAAVIPAGGRRARATHGELGVLATRTTRFVRAHVNARVGVGPSDDDAETPRWFAGLAINRPLALKVTLLGAELTAEQRRGESDVAWRAGAGVRAQWTPRLSMDAGVGRTLSGARTEWSVTFGSAFAFSIPALQLRGTR